MKRRKWWLIALSLSLLAACVGVWKWSERPPYAFMKGATLDSLWIRVGFGPDTAVRSYALRAQFEDVAGLAQTEMARLGWNDLRKFESIAKSLGDDVGFSPHSDVDGWLGESIMLERPRSGSELVIVTISGPATTSDRARIWFKKTILRDDR